MAIAIGLLAGVVAFVARHALVGFALTRAASVLSGQRVSLDAFQIGSTRIVLDGVHVSTAAGDPLLDVRHVVLQYSLGLLLHGTGRRYGISAIEVDGPTLAIVRRANGSYNVAGASGGGQTTAATPPAGAPWLLDLRLRDGEIRLIDRAPVAPDLAQERIVGVSLDARIRSDRRSSGVGSGALESAQTSADRAQHWPFKIGGSVDVPRGLALLRLDAPQIPLRGPVGFLQHSPAVRVDDGVLHTFRIRVFALDLGHAGPPSFHIGGSADLTRGRLAIASLALPVRDVVGRIVLDDDGISSRRLDGRIAGLSVVGRGGAFDRWHPTLRLGLAANGDLRVLRRIFGFARFQPISGSAHLETVLEAPVSNLLIRSALRVSHGAYGGVPFDDVAGRVDYHAGSVVLDGVTGRYGSANVGVGGRFLLGSSLDSAIVATATAPGRTIPFAENLAPAARIDALTLIRGHGSSYGARGALGVAGGGTTGAGMFAVDDLGAGEFGPFILNRSDGSSLVGALRLERAISQSAAWLSARRYRVEVPATAARFAGLNVPAFPPVAGVIDGDLAGGGSPDAFALAGTLRGTSLRVAGAQLGSGRAILSGTLADVRLGDVVIGGPSGRFAGSAAAGHSTFALRGTYDGLLQALVPFTGRQSAYGHVRGDVLAAIDGTGVEVQSSGAVLRGASVHGVALDAARGTLAVRARQFHLVAASGSIGGHRAVAAESGGLIAVSAPDIPSRALRGTGLPLEAGNVSAYGVADLRSTSPRFRGTVAVADGLARGYHVTGDARIELAGQRVRVAGATGALGATYGSLGGDIDGIGAHALRYALTAHVPLGDIQALRAELDLPVHHLAGTFGANLRVGGSGNRPSAAGSIDVPEGVYNGLAFRAARARIALGPSGIAARDGTITVGSTTTALAASIMHGELAFAARSQAADLADFDDFFDAGETLDGRGAFDLALRSGASGVTTRGSIGFSGLRYAAYTLGRTNVAWATRDGRIETKADIQNPSGGLRLVGSVAPQRGSPSLTAAFGRGGYDLRAQLHHVDVGAWLTAAGFDYPVNGRADAAIGVTGRLPRLAVRADVSLADATVAGFAVRDAHLRAAANGSRIDVARGDADLGFAKIDANGRLGLGRSDPLAFNVRVTTDDVGRAVKRFVPASRGRTIAGTLDADVRIRGTRGAPQIDGGFDLENARYADFGVPRAIGELALAGNDVELRDAEVEFTHGQAFIAGSLPLELQPLGLGPPNAPLSVDVTARGVDLAQFAPLLPDGTTLGGLLDGRFGVEGSVEHPRMLGSLAISEGKYASPFERAPIGRVGAKLDFAGTTIKLAAFHADVGSGTLDADGRLALPSRDAPQPHYAAHVRANAATFDLPAYGRGTIDGDLQIAGSGPEPLIAGDVSLANAVIPVSAVYGGSPSAASAGGSTTALDPRFRIHAASGDNVRVRNSIVNIGVAGAVDLTGTLRSPQLSGTFTATDGTISSYNHVFRILNAAVSFDPADGTVPTIAARAVSRVPNPDPDPSRNISGSANIYVTVSGTADDNNLQVTYSSEPAYSQEQIVGLLLDVPALLGAVNFNLNGGPGSPLLRGAPPETNVLLPPGITPVQVSAISLNQEVFSLLNGQFTQRALSPIERAFEKTLGLSDVQFTVDYGGGLGYALRRQIGKRDFYAFLSQTVTYPERVNLGFTLAPRAYQSVNFSIYTQNGVTSLITNQTPGEEFFGSNRRLTSVQPLGNRAGVSLTFDRRF